MKTLKYIIITLACLLLFVSCDSAPVDDAQSSDPAVSQKSTEPITSDTETDTQQPPIGRDYAPLALYWNTNVDSFIHFENTFLTEDKEKLSELTNKWYELYWDKYVVCDDFPPMLLFMIEELGATREDFETYQEAVISYDQDECICTEEMIDAIFSNDEALRKRVLKHPLAVYADDGHIYTFRNLQDMTTAEIEALGLSEQEWADYIATVTPELPPMDSIDFLLPFAGDATPTTESAAADITAAPEPPAPDTEAPAADTASEPEAPVPEATAA